MTAVRVTFDRCSPTWADADGWLTTERVELDDAQQVAERLSGQVRNARIEIVEDET